MYSKKLLRKHSDWIIVSSHIEQVDVEVAYNAISSGAFLIDVREYHEYEAGHASNAVLIPLSILGEKLKDIPMENDIYIICTNGTRSQQACDALSALGYHVNNIVGGSVEWMNRSLPFEAESGEPYVI